MSKFQNNERLPDHRMNEKDKAEFAEALAFRYVQLTLLANSANHARYWVDQTTAQSAEELERLSKILSDLPEDIQELVNESIRLHQQ
ncbi:hypothetical protein [Paenibacillus donghaensis]|uniref:Uncharacterized protein n=1 Tax=Paenibacillus donghaensis TaxID=414771 RepID=A0A2Z2KNB9_9BACL|nr:hypothetical protein [Paenibacillus donghaensis]ASA20238.1 hypothetical protein B9T62_05140 [Paenibacillus donghaensis]